MSSTLKPAEAQLIYAGAWENSQSAEERLEQLLEGGKASLRLGRELSRGGLAYGEAEIALQDAMTAFEEASAIAPDSPRVLVRHDTEPRTCHCTWCRATIGGISQTRKLQTSPASN